MDGAHATERIEVTAPQDSLPLLDLLMSAVGLVVLGMAVGLGTGDVSLAMRVGPAFAGPIVGALLLTTPGLVVAHQFLDVQAGLASLVDGVARGLRASGALAWGLAPFAAYFSSTAPGWWPVLLGGLGSGVAATALVVAGAHVTRDARGAAQRVSWSAVVFGWILLTAAIGVRLAAFGWQE